MMNIMLTPRWFMRTTLGATVVVTGAHPLALLLPVRAIIVERVKPLPLLGKLLLGGRQQTEPIAASL